MYHIHLGIFFLLSICHLLAEIMHNNAELNYEVQPDLQWNIRLEVRVTFGNSLQNRKLEDPLSHLKWHQLFLHPTVSL